MTYDKFRAQVESARDEGIPRLVVPVHTRRSADLLTPVSAYLALQQDTHTAFFLRASKGAKSWRAIPFSAATRTGC